VHKGTADATDVILDDYLELATHMLPSKSTEADMPVLPVLRPAVGSPTSSTAAHLAPVLPGSAPDCVLSMGSGELTCAQFEELTEGDIVCLPGLLPVEACATALTAASESLLPSILNTNVDDRARHSGDPNRSARVHGLRAVDYLCHRRPDLVEGRYQWGASWLLSQPGCKRQTPHRDFDCVKVTEHCQHQGAVSPATFWVSLQDGGLLYIKSHGDWYKLHVRAGDAVVFKGQHCGAENSGEDPGRRRTEADGTP